MLARYKAADSGSDVAVMALSLCLLPIVLHVATSLVIGNNSWQHDANVKHDLVDLLRPILVAGDDGAQVDIASSDTKANKLRHKLKKAPLAIILANTDEGDKNNKSLQDLIDNLKHTHSVQSIEKKETPIKHSVNNKKNEPPEESKEREDNTIHSRSGKLVTEEKISKSTKKFHTNTVHPTHFKEIVVHDGNRKFHNNAESKWASDHKKRIAKLKEVIQSISQAIKESIYSKEANSIEYEEHNHQEPEHALPYESSFSDVISNSLKNLGAKQETFDKLIKITGNEIEHKQTPHVDLSLENKQNENSIFEDLKQLSESDKHAEADAPENTDQDHGPNGASDRKQHNVFQLSFHFNH